jgi:hypothetical protein
MMCGQDYRMPVFLFVEGNKWVKLGGWRRKTNISKALFVGIGDKPDDRRNSN